jgi:hypothetical protein
VVAPPPTRRSFLRGGGGGAIWGGPGETLNPKPKLIKIDALVSRLHFFFYPIKLKKKRERESASVRAWWSAARFKNNALLLSKTHTHTHTQRERERETKSYIFFFLRYARAAHPPLCGACVFPGFSLGIPTKEDAALDFKSVLSFRFQREPDRTRGKKRRWSWG